MSNQPQRPRPVMVKRPEFLRPEMMEAIDVLIEKMQNDYVYYLTRKTCGRLRDGRLNVELRCTNKYITILYQETRADIEPTRFWGHIVNRDSDPKFKYGDMLAYGPTRNVSRGNLFDEQYDVEFSGPLHVAQMRLSPQERDEQRFQGWADHRPPTTNITN